MNYLLPRICDNFFVKPKVNTVLTLLNFALLSFCTSTAHAQIGNFFIDLDISTQSDSNINQAKLNSDSVEDSITSENLTVGYQHTIDNLRALTMTVGIAGKQFREVDTQNSQSGILGAAFMWQNRIAYRAPIYQLSVKTEFQNNVSKQQDSTIINAEFFMSSRLTDIITGTLGLGYKYRDSESSVYDLTDARIFANADYALSKRATLYSTISFINGDTFSVVRPDTDAERYIALAAGKKNIQWDEAYNQAFPSKVTPWQAYRINASSQILSLGFNYGFSHGSSIDLSFTRADVSGDADASYERDIINASLLKRF